MVNIDIFKISEFFLVPLCLLAIIILSRKGKAFFDSPIERKFYYWALWIRILFTFIYILTITFYYKGGDTFIYYQAIVDMQTAVKDNFSVMGEIYGNIALEPTQQVYAYMMYDGTNLTHYYMLIPQSYMVPRFGLPFSLLFGGSYICISLCVTYFSFLGCWKMYKTFGAIYPALKRQAAVACLFLPSCVFWGVGLLKDSISIGALGFLFYTSYHIFFGKRRSVLLLVGLILSSLLLYYVKSYIFLCYTAGFVIWLFARFDRRIEDKTLRSVARMLFLFVGLLAMFFTIRGFTSSDEGSKFAAEKIVESINSQQKGFDANSDKGASFDVKKIDNSVTGLLLQFPMGVVTTFFRPFLWEVRSPFMILSTLEALIFLILTIKCFRVAGFKGFFRQIFSTPVLLMCFFFSLLFAGFVGLSTPNFGALVRYKIPALPFYSMMIFAIMHQSGNFKGKYFFRKGLF